LGRSWLFLIYDSIFLFYQTTYVIAQQYFSLRKAILEKLLNCYCRFIGELIQQQFVCGFYKSVIIFGM
jgi:hypothetical protein